MTRPLPNGTRRILPSRLSNLMALLVAKLFLRATEHGALESTLALTPAPSLADDTTTSRRVLSPLLAKIERR